LIADRYDNQEQAEVMPKKDVVQFKEVRDIRDKGSIKRDE
jgi:hypothetical protein